MLELVGILGALRSPWDASGVWPWSPHRRLPALWDTQAVSKVFVPSCICLLSPPTLGPTERYPTGPGRPSPGPATEIQKAWGVGYLPKGPDVEARG